MNLSLRAKVRLLILALLVALGIGSFFAFWVLSGVEAGRRVTEDSRNVNTLLNRFIFGNLVNLKEQVAVTSATPMLRLACYMGDVRSMSERLNLPGSKPSNGGLAVLQADGYVIARGGRWPIGLTRLPLDGSVSTLEPGKCIGFVQPILGRICMVAVTPIVVAPERRELIVGLSEVGGGAIEALARANSSEIILVQAGHSLQETRPFTGEVDEHAGAFQLLDSGKEQFMGVYSPFPASDEHTRLGIVSLQRREDLISPFKRMSATFGAILLGILALGFFLGDKFVGSLVTPLDELVTAAQSMKDGETPNPIAVGSRSDEVAVLQNVFNSMVLAVHENQQLLLGMIDIDPLTRLLNHRAFQERLINEISRAKESRRPVTLMLLDLDHFKDFNSAHGHASGDVHLQSFADMLRATCPDAALIARYAGDKFGIALPNRDLESAEATAVEIRMRIRGAGSLIDCSVGLSELDASAPTAEALLLATELALKRAKQLGGGRVSRFERNDLEESAEQTELLQRYLADGSLDTIQALAAAVDAKDQYTKGHSERVAHLARGLAEYLGCPRMFIELVYQAGTLHDVGKIGVPDAILSKPDRLTDEEMRIMETHPVLGEVIVAKVPRLVPLIPGVRHHHERWDGTGYPDRLSGQDIPEIALYLAVADTFDAMTSDRPYRKALSVHTALKEIERCSGAQFHPGIAEAFVKMVKLTLPAGV